MGIEGRPEVLKADGEAIAPCGVGEITVGIKQGSNIREMRPNLNLGSDSMPYTESMQCVGGKCLRCAGALLIITDNEGTLVDSWAGPVIVDSCPEMVAEN